VLLAPAFPLASLSETIPSGGNVTLARGFGCAAAEHWVLLYLSALGLIKSKPGIVSGFPNKQNTPHS
jgi:hypothetical protein